MTKVKTMTKVRFIDNARISVRISDNNTIHIKPEQLPESIITMIAKQIMPSIDLVLSVHIQESSITDDAIVINAITWDGCIIERYIYRHYENGRFEEVTKDIF